MGEGWGEGALLTSKELGDAHFSTFALLYARPNLKHFVFVFIEYRPNRRIRNTQVERYNVQRHVVRDSTIRESYSGHKQVTARYQTRENFGWHSVA